MSTLRDGYMQGISNTDMVSAAKNQQKALVDSTAREAVKQAAPILQEEGAAMYANKLQQEQYINGRIAEVDDALQRGATPELLINKYGIEPKLIEGAIKLQEDRHMKDIASRYPEQYSTFTGVK